MLNMQSIKLCLGESTLVLGLVDLVGAAQTLVTADDVLDKYVDGQSVRCTSGRTQVPPRTVRARWRCTLRHQDCLPNRPVQPEFPMNNEINTIIQGTDQFSEDAFLDQLCH